MAFKAILLYASALLVQSISACGYSYGSPSCGCSPSCGNNYVSVSNDGGSFIVTGLGPVVPSGIAVSSDIALNGDLDVCGALPFLSAVAFNDCYDTSGSAGVSYGCGDGSVGIQNVNGGNSIGLGGNSIGLGGNSIGLGGNSIGLGGNSIGLAGNNGCGCSCN